MPPDRRARKAPGALPLTDERDLYIGLMRQGVSNAEACRIVGVHPRTGYRWRDGRSITLRTGEIRTYPAITRPARPVSARFLSEAERVTIADGLLQQRSIRAIAAELGRAPSTVSREIRRNRDTGTGTFHPFRAQRQAAGRRLRPKTAEAGPRLRAAGLRRGPPRSALEPGADQPGPGRAVPGPARDARRDRDDLRGALHAGCWPAPSRPRTGAPKRACPPQAAPPIRRAPRPVHRAHADDRRASCRGGRPSRPGPLGRVTSSWAVPTAPPSVRSWSARLATSCCCTCPTATTRSRSAMPSPTPSQPLPPRLWRSLTWDQGVEMGRHDEFTQAADVSGLLLRAGESLAAGHQREHQRPAPPVLPQGHGPQRPYRGGSRWRRCRTQCQAAQDTRLGDPFGPSR